MRIVPFIYLSIYGVIALCSGFISESVASIIDFILFVSPAASSFLLFLSKVLGMCSWHKTACILPYTSQVVSFVDTHIITLTQIEMVFINFAIGMVIMVFIVTSFKHFFLQDA